VLAEAVLAGLLVATLAFSPRDGVPTDDSMVALPSESVTRLLASTMAPTSIGMILPGMSDRSSWAKITGKRATANALIPKAPPVQLLIPSLKVNRPVEGIGVNRNGVLDLPVNGWNAGWYKGSPVPGAPGDAVIQGHAGLPNEPMLFGNLFKLKQGEKIIIVLADGSQQLFLVQSMSVVPIGTAPPGIADPSGPPRLTLVTCTGHFDKDKKYYTERLVLEATYAGIV
jgi:LPXTG-site transpeptidase (sortase) family protein